MNINNKVKSFNGFIFHNGLEEEITFNALGDNAALSDYRTICYSNEELSQLILEKVKTGTIRFEIKNSKFDSRNTDNLNKQFTQIIVKEKKLI